MRRTPPPAACIDAVVWLQAPSEVRRTRALSRDGATYEPFWDIWADPGGGLAGRRRRGRAADVVVDPGPAGAAPEQVLAALASLPVLEHALAPERAARERRPAGSRRRRGSLSGRRGGLPPPVCRRSPQRLAGQFQRPRSRRPEPDQHHGRRRRQLRPVGRAPQRHHAGAPAQHHRTDRRRVLPLAGQRLGTPPRHRRRGRARRLRPGLARLPGLRTQA